MIDPVRVDALNQEWAAALDYAGYRVRDIRLYAFPGGMSGEENRAYYFTPAWSPDGSRIAYDYWTPAATGIAVVSVSGGMPTIISAERSGAYDGSPVWSPDGKSLAYTRGRPWRPGSRIWVAAGDGSGARQLTHADRYSDWTPSWSPDGRQITFARSVPLIDRGYARIWVMNADGSGKRRLTSGHASGDEAPAWSPDGRQIAFDRGGRVFTIDPTGSRKARLADSRPMPKFAADFGPQWSADGSRLAFLRTSPPTFRPWRVWVETLKPSRLPPQPL